MMGGFVSKLLGIVLAGGGLWWLWHWLHPAPERIQIVSPAQNATVHSPVTIHGIGSAIFENTLGVRVRDESGTVIGAGSVLVNALPGNRGPFTGHVDYTLTGPSQYGRIEVYDSSPRDGGLIHLSSVEVTLA
ncbi:MAG: Gmad2 immunoglobulin-like domain-containing protein [Chloroflexi bacterium]|nr:Gmad2 immunoglobulin-like domain-containing protein [Chloroflexota bacterium]